VLLYFEFLEANDVGLHLLDPRLEILLTLLMLNVAIFNVGLASPEKTILC
jgi:hypothetical protein